MRTTKDLIFEAMEWADELGDERATDGLAELVMHASELRREVVRQRRSLARRLRAPQTQKTREGE